MMSYIKKSVPIIVFLLFVTISITLWKNENAHRRELLQKSTATSSEQMRIRIEGLMNARFAALKLLAQRWVERTPPDFSKNRFMGFADDLYMHFQGFTGINWIDPQGVVRWVFPMDSTNQKAVNRNIFRHPDPGFRDSFSLAMKSRRNRVSPCTDLFQGGMGFEVFYPLVHDKNIQGVLSGVFMVDRIMDICLGPDISGSFYLNLYENGRLIYSNESEHIKNLERNELTVTREIQFTGKTWQLEITPNSALLSSLKRHALPILIFGLITSLGFSLLLFFLIKRMEMYGQARDLALHEVNERKRSENALKENEKKLQELLDELVRKSSELEAFVYTVSHDLKSPIVTIEGFISALREDFGDRISHEGDKYLDYISDALKKMEHLIQDLLELSRIGRTEGKKEDFPFGDLLEEVITGLQPRISEKSIQVNITGDLPLVYGEKKRLGQVMENLLSNSIKYMGRNNTSPRIDIGITQQQGHPVFFVRDNGIGIPKHYHEKIFQVFQRLPAAKKLGGGTGVGLAIVKRIIEQHGGKIWLESNPLKGTTFFFKLKARTEYTDDI